MDYSPEQERSTWIMICIIAALICVPLLVGTIYDAIYPEAAKVDDRFTPSFEQFKIDTYERMTDRDLARSGLRDDEELRQTYNKIADAHWELVMHQTRSRLLMYGLPFLASLGYLFYAWRSWKKQSRAAAKKALERSAES